MSSDNVLLKRAKETLERVWNKNNLYTPSSDEGAGVQRIFDTGLLSYGYIHFDIDKIIDQYRSAFKGQWKNGMLPGSIFYNNTPSHFPDIDFWDQRKENDNSPEIVNTSSFIHPAMSAILLWDVYVKIIKEKGEKEGKIFLEEFYSKIFSAHNYLLKERDVEGSGMVTIFHPFESGFLHSTRWSEVLDTITPTNIMPYHRIDSGESDGENHYTKKQYDVLVFLSQNFLEKEYDFSKTQFQVKDVVASCMLYLSNKKLRKMASVLNKDTAEIDTWLSRFEMNFIKTYFDEESKTFRDYDLVEKRLIGGSTLVSFSSLITGLMSSEFLERTVDIFIREEIPRMKKKGFDKVSNEEIVLLWLILKGFAEHGGEYKGLRKIRGCLRDILRDKISNDNYKKIDGEFEYVFSALFIDVLEGDRE